ncbi:MAG: nitroreductase family protein [Lachnospiraceae bacterium]|jgi:nitroreductase
MSDILEELKARRSIRKFKDEPVPKELVDKVVEAGLYAPSGMDTQTDIILRIEDPDTVRRLGLLNAKVMGRDSDAFYGAPVVLCVLGKRERAGGAEKEGAAMMENMLSEASSLGLGSCWVTRGADQFKSEEGQQILRKAGIDPEVYFCVDNVILGWPEGEVHWTTPRKPNRVFSIG